MRKHKSHAVGDLCKRGVTLPTWQALEASLARDATATPPPSDAANDTASTDAARALAGDRAKLLTGGADGDALRALVALLSGAVVPDDAAAAAGGARVSSQRYCSPAAPLPSLAPPLPSPCATIIASSVAPNVPKCTTA